MPQPLAAKTETQPRSNTGLCVRQEIEYPAETEAVIREHCTTMFDPYCATHDGRDRSTRKFGPNATILKYPRYPNHPENVFKPGYSEWHHETIQPIKREFLWSRQNKGGVSQSGRSSRGANKRQRRRASCSTTFLADKLLQGISTPYESLPNGSQ